MRKRLLFFFLRIIIIIRVALARKVLPNGTLSADEREEKSDYFPAVLRRVRYK